MTKDSTKVLIVDDDPAICRLLAKWVEAAGFTVECAADGVHAKEAIRDSCPHILLTDWEMPDMDGVELCKWLRSQNLPHYVYTIILTARSHSEDMVSGLQSGADDFLSKPVGKAELLARLTSGKRVIDLEKRLSQIAKSDSLTGLATQRILYEELSREFARSRRHHSMLSCVMIDLDFFKSINDTHGHPVGDRVLKEVAAVLEESVRITDVVCRYGGEEFCVLLPETDESNAAEWAERVRKRIEDLAINLGDFDLHVTASIGVAQVMIDTENPQELVDLADQALLVAKRSGRNRVVSFSSLANDTKIESEVWGPGAIFGELSAKSVMTSIVAGLNHNKTLGEAAQYFLRLRLNSAPVVDDEGKLVGMISEKDVMSMMLWPNWWSTRISEVVRRNVICYEEDSPVLKIYEFLCRVSIRSVVVVKDGRPTGVIGRGGLLRWFINALQASPYYDAHHNRVVDEFTNFSAHQVVQAVSGSIRDEADRLRDYTEEASPEDLLPCMITTATRIQDLTNDLLSCSYDARIHQVEFERGEATKGVEDESGDSVEGIGKLLSNLSNYQLDTVRGD